MARSLQLGHCIEWHVDLCPVRRSISSFQKLSPGHALTTNQWNSKCSGCVQPLVGSTSFPLSGMNSSLLTASHASHLTNLQVDRMVSDFHLWGCRNSWENHSFGSFNVWRWDRRLWVGLLYRPYRHQNFCHFHNQSFFQECDHAPKILWVLLLVSFEALSSEWNGIPVIFIAAWRQTSLHFLAAPGNHIYSW